RLFWSLKGLTISERDLELGGGHGVDLAGRNRVLHVRDVDDAVGVRGRCPEPVEILEVTATHLRAKHRYRRSGGIGAGQGTDLVAGGEGVGGDVRSGWAGPAGVRR